MADTVNAVVTRERGIQHGPTRHEVDDVVELAPNQFRDWNKLGWVERASAEQIATFKAKLEAKAAAEAAAAEKPARKSRPAKSKSKAAKPA